VTEKARYTHEEEMEILRRYRAETGETYPFDSLEDLIFSLDGFALGIDLDTNANWSTPLQHAIVRMIEGRPLGDLAGNPVVQRAVGTAELPKWDGPPTEVDILAAVRGGKSTIAAAAGLHATQKCNLSGLSRSEIPRFSIVSLEKDNAAVTYGHLVSALDQPKLCHLKVPKDASDKWVEQIRDSGLSFNQSVFIWHPTGRPIEIRVTAGKRAGGGLISRWCIGLVLDEAPRMQGEDEAVVNYTEAKRAVRTRLRPGAQIFTIGSPHRASGPVYDRYITHFGNPTKRRIVIKANGPSLNPYWWTAARCAEIREEDPDAYKTDVQAEFLEPISALVHPIEVNRNMRKTPKHREPEEGHEYVARMDPATRRNAWTFALADRVGMKKRIVYNQEWKGTSIQPLSPKEVLLQIGRVLKKYGCDAVTSDQWSAESIADLSADLVDPETAEDLSFTLIREDWPSGERKKHYENFAKALANDEIELPPDNLAANDIRLIQKRPTSDSFTIVLPKTGDGRHCDYAPTFVGLLKDWIDDEMELAPKEGEEGYNEYLEALEEERELAEFERLQTEEWWERPPWERPYGW